MNLSNLIASPPEPPKGKGSVDLGSSETSEQPEGAEFLALTQDTSAATTTAAATAAGSIETGQLANAAASVIADALGAAEDTVEGEASLPGPEDGLLVPSLVQVPTTPIPDDAPLTPQVVVRPDAEGLNPKPAENNVPASQPAVRQTNPVTAAQASILTSEIAAPANVQNTVTPEAGPTTPVATVTAPNQAQTQIANGSQTGPAANLSPQPPRSRNSSASEQPLTEDTAQSDRPANQQRADAVSRTPQEQVSIVQPTSAGPQADWRALQALYSQGGLQSSSLETFVGSQPQTSASPVASSSGTAVGALTSELSQQAVQRGILPQIVGSIQNVSGGSVIDLMLDPPELGRIEIVIELSDKSLRATLTADKSFTGDLIRRQADDLLQQFADAGFGDVDLQFADSREDTQDGGEGEVSSLRGPDEAVPSNTQTSRSISPSPVSGRIDMRL